MGVQPLILRDQPLTQQADAADGRRECPQPNQQRSADHKFGWRLTYFICNFQAVAAHIKANFPNHFFHIKSKHIHGMVQYQMLFGIPCNLRAQE